MINNQKCDSCAFAPKCLAKSKLKPFSNLAKTDMGVVLDFKSCDGYRKVTAEDEEE